jgi:hypothetical protein
MPALFYRLLTPKSPFIKKLAFCFCYAFLLVLVAQAGNAQADEKGAPALKTGWQRIYIENVGSIDLPPTMEIQNESMKEAIYKPFNMKIPQFIAQTKGTNENPKIGFERYARVMIETEIGNFGDYEKLDFNIYQFSKKDITELDMIIKQHVQQEWSANPRIGMKLIEWYPIKIEKINEMSCLHTSWIRQTHNNPVVLEHAYLFYNNDRFHRLSIFCNLSYSDYWKADFADILKSFRITNIR